VRVVLDSSAVVAAVRSDRGASRLLLVGALNRRLDLLISVPLLIEYEAVLSRADHLRASGLSIDDIAVLLDAVAAVALPVRLDFLWRPVLQDPGDEMVLETAVNGRADGIVTFNHRDFAAASTQFGIPVWSPGEAVKRLGRKV
jgi:putative PIN family toxin of toxin-antitoxin system